HALLNGRLELVVDEADGVDAAFDEFLRRDVGQLPRTLERRLTDRAWVLGPDGELAAPEGVAPLTPDDLESDLVGRRLLLLPEGEAGAEDVGVEAAREAPVRRDGDE